MAISTDILTSYKKIDEAYIDSLLEKEIEKNHKKLLCWTMILQEYRRFMIFSVYTGWDKDSIRQGFEEENSLSMY